MRLVMNANQIIVATILGLNLFVNLIDHGKDKKGKYSFWVALIDTYIWAIILKGGGFF